MKTSTKILGAGALAAVLSGCASIPGVPTPNPANTQTGQAISKKFAAMCAKPAEQLNLVQKGACKAKGLAVTARGYVTDAAGRADAAVSSAITGAGAPVPDEATTELQEALNRAKCRGKNGKPLTEDGLGGGATSNTNFAFDTINTKNGGDVPKTAAGVDGAALKCG